MQQTRKKLQDSTIKALFLSELGNNLNYAHKKDKNAHLKAQNRRIRLIKPLQEINDEANLNMKHKDETDQRQFCFKKTRCHLFHMLRIFLWRSNLYVPRIQRKRDKEKNKTREDLPFTSVSVRRGQRINFQDPDIRNEKVTRILRLLVMLMGPNLKWNFIHILKSDSEISFRCSSHFLLALMISRSECGERGEREKERRKKIKRKIPKVL